MATTTEDPKVADPSKMPDPQASLFTLEVGGETPDKSSLKIRGTVLKDLLREFKRGDKIRISATLLIDQVDFKEDERVHHASMYFVTQEDGGSLQDLGETPEDEPKPQPEATEPAGELMDGTATEEEVEDVEDAEVVEESEAEADPIQPEAGVGVPAEGDVDEDNPNLEWD